MKAMLWCGSPQPHRWSRSEPHFWASLIDASMRASILDGDETRLKPGNIVIQRGTSHAWVAHGGPAFFMGVVIARELDRA